MEQKEVDEVLKILCLTNIFSHDYVAIKTILMSYVTFRGKDN